MRNIQTFKWVLCGLASLGSVSLSAQAVAASEPVAGSQELSAPVAQGQDVKPGQTFVDPLMYVRAPNETGWKMGPQRGDALSFTKSGKVAGEGYAAQVQIFPLPDNLDHEALVAKIRKDVEKDSPTDRFKSLRSVFTYSAKRGYPCVKFDGLTEYTPGQGQAPIRLEARSLYCRHPGAESTGFVVTFLHHGASSDKNLAHEAESFFQGVKAVVPQSKPSATSGTKH